MITNRTHTTTTHANPLPTDSYYRGYRLSYCGPEVHVHQGPEFIETVTTGDEAKSHIDGWLDAK